ncbi:hypothetical protein EDB84DRAFT_1455373, partial [Lactarius hengduanensis]
CGSSYCTILLSIVSTHACCPCRRPRSHYLFDDPAYSLPTRLSMSYLMPSILRLDRLYVPSRFLPAPMPPFSYTTFPLTSYLCSDVATDLLVFQPF